MTYHDSDNDSDYYYDVTRHEVSECFFGDAMHDRVLRNVWQRSGRDTE